jgi:glycosyltransferase involved in cell wall biosynthesis
MTRGARFRRVRRLGEFLTARAALAAIGEIGFDREHLLVSAYTTAALPLLDRLPGACSVYMTFDEVLDPREPELLRRVHHVFGHSPPAVERNQWVGEKLSQMTTAIDPEPFIAARATPRPPADLSSLRRPLIGYGGALSQRIDWRILRKVAEQARGTLVLVGPVLDDEGAREVRELAKSPAVAWLGHRGSIESPHYLAAFDAALVPYKRNGFNDGSNPVKFFEYLAAGVPVITVPLPALAQFGGVATFADDPSQFAAAANAAVSQPVDREAIQRRQKVAREHSYDHLVSRMEDRLACGKCFKH